MVTIKFTGGREGDKFNFGNGKWMLKCGGDRQSGGGGGSGGTEGEWR